MLEAEAELWGSVPGPVGYDDPRAIKALGTYAQRMEVRTAVLAWISVHPFADTVQLAYQQHCDGKTQCCGGMRHDPCIAALVC